MRAAAIWTSHHEDLNKAREKANLSKSYGFIYVPIILECFIGRWKGLDMHNEFIEKCLEKCSI